MDCVQEPLKEDQVQPSVELEPDLPEMGDPLESEAFMKSHDTGSVRVAPLYLEGIHPADTIRRVADERGTDLVVMGTRGRSPSAGILLGSVAQETLIASRVPVLVVQGSPEEMGEQAGVLALKPTAGLLKLVDDFVESRDAGEREEVGLRGHEDLGAGHERVH